MSVNSSPVKQHLKKIVKNKVNVQSTLTDKLRICIVV